MSNRRRGLDWRDTRPWLIRTVDKYRYWRRLGYRPSRAVQMMRRFR